MYLDPDNAAAAAAAVAYFDLDIAAVSQLTAAVVGVAAAAAAAVEPLAADKAGTAGDKQVEVGPCNHMVGSKEGIDLGNTVEGVQDTSGPAHPEPVAASLCRFCCHRPPGSSVREPPSFGDPLMGRMSYRMAVAAEC